MTSPQSLLSPLALEALPPRHCPPGSCPWSLGLVLHTTRVQKTAESQGGRDAIHGDKVQRAPGDHRESTEVPKSPGVKVLSPVS